MILGKRRVNPSALFAKLLEVTPSKTAIPKKKVGSSETHFITLNDISLNLYNYLGIGVAPVSKLAIFPSLYL